jgi:hypothetical protein
LSLDIFADTRIEATDVRLQGLYGVVHGAPEN